MKVKLEDYEKLVEGKRCRWCGTELPPKIEYYAHPGGWEVEGFPTLLWLYVTCPKCNYDWALWKLGISRPVGKIIDKWE